MIQCRSSHALAGNTRFPLKVAPAANSIVSPQLAPFKAFCRLPPALTTVTAPGAGVFAMLVCMRICGSWAGPSVVPPPPVDAGAATDRDSDWLALLLLASVTLALNENCPVWVVVPLNCPVLLRLKPCGSVPEATVH